MVRVGHADLRIGARAHLAAEHERAHARQVGLEGQHLQVEHQLGVLLERGRDAGRPLDDRQLARALLLGLLNAPLDVADRVEVLGRAWRWSRVPELLLQAGDLVRVTESRMLRSFWMRASRAAGSVLSLAPNSRSNTARGSFSIGSGVVGVRQEIVLA